MTVTVTATVTVTVNVNVNVTVTVTMTVIVRSQRMSKVMMSTATWATNYASDHDSDVGRFFNCTVVFPSIHSSVCYSLFTGRRLCFLMKPSSLFVTNIA